MRWILWKTLVLLPASTIVAVHYCWSFVDHKCTLHVKWAGGGWCLPLLMLYGPFILTWVRNRKSLPVCFIQLFKSEWWEGQSIASGAVIFIDAHPFALYPSFEHQILERKISAANMIDRPMAIEKNATEVWAQLPTIIDSPKKIDFYKSICCKQVKYSYLNMLLYYKTAQFIWRKRWPTFIYIKMWLGPLYVWKSGSFLHPQYS